MFDPSFLFWGVGIIYIYHIESRNGRENTLKITRYILLCRWFTLWIPGPGVPLWYFLHVEIVQNSLPYLNYESTIEWVRTNEYMTCWYLLIPSPTLEKKLQNCVRHWHCNANLKFQGSNPKTAVEVAFETHGADNRKGWVGPVLTEAQTCSLPLLWANMFGLRTRNQRTANQWESHEARNRCAEPCCFRGFPDRCLPKLFVCVGEISYF